MKTADAPTRKQHPGRKMTREMLLEIHTFRTAYRLSLWQCCAVLESRYGVSISREQMRRRLSDLS